MKTKNIIIWTVSSLSLTGLLVYLFRDKIFKSKTDNNNETPADEKMGASSTLDSGILKGGENIQQVNSNEAADDASKSSLNTLFSKWLEMKKTNQPRYEPQMKSIQQQLVKLGFQIKNSNGNYSLVKNVTKPTISLPLVKAPVNKGNQEISKPVTSNVNTGRG